MLYLNGLGCVLLVAGGTMYGVCINDSDCNHSITLAGKIMMIIGGTLEALVVASWLFNERRGLTTQQPPVVRMMSPV